MATAAAKSQLRTSSRWTTVRRRLETRENARVPGLPRIVIRGEREVLVRLYSAVKGEYKPWGIGFDAYKMV